MADKKISQLSAASTPLAGTEVLPLVQSGSTVKVASNDLTVKNVRSNATTGILQIAGPAAAATRTMTVPDANFTVARTDAANSFTDDQTLATGNLVIGTAGKGIDFSANTHAAGMTSELLNDYEEGTYTPSLTFGGGTADQVYSVRVGRYTKIGRVVHVQVSIIFSDKGTSTGNAEITLPFAVADALTPASFQFVTVTHTGFLQGFAETSATVVKLQTNSDAGETGNLADTNFANSSRVYMSMTYIV